MTTNHHKLVFWSRLSCWRCFSNFFLGFKLPNTTTPTSPVWKWRNQRFHNRSSEFLFFHRFNYLSRFYVWTLSSVSFTSVLLSILFIAKISRTIFFCLLFRAERKKTTCFDHDREKSSEISITKCVPSPEPRRRQQTVAEKRPGSITKSSIGSRMARKSNLF